MPTPQVSPQHMFEQGPPIPVHHTAPSARTIGDMFRLRAARSATRASLYFKADGQWRAHSWGEFYEQSASIASGLLDLNFTQGDRVAILGPTQPPWAVYDMGSQLAGLASFGIYPKQAAEQIRYLLEHSEAKVVFVADPKELDNVLEAAKGLDTLEAIVPWTQALFHDYKDRDPRILSPQQFEGEPLADEKIEEIQKAIDPNDTAILVYTSGTTGPPKGAMISHANILAFLSASQHVVPFYESDITLNFLPMAHVAERILGFYSRITAGIAGAYAESTATVLQDLADIRPTIFGSVPRIFEKAFGKIHTEIERKPPVVQKLFRWAKSVGEERTQYVIEGRRVPTSVAVQYALAEKLVFKKVRAAFGGNVRMMIVGAAPTPRDVLKFFWAAGMPMYEAYGMTEGTVISHINREGSIRLGTVGRVIPPTSVKIAEDGEVLVKGPWVFKGYFKNDDATATTVIDEWLYTGDVGEIDEDGFLKITDRKKHLIITAGGKNLAPANIEKAIKSQDGLISQVHAHGDKRPYVSALITAGPLETLEWGLERGLTTEAEVEARRQELMENPAGRSDALNSAMAKIVVHPEFIERIRAAVRRGNDELARVERVRRFVLLERDFSQEAGELTPTLKVKRRAIEKKYIETFDKIYNDNAYALEP